MTNSMLHWPLMRLSQSLFQHLRTYRARANRIIVSLLYMGLWKLSFFTIFIANLSKSFRLYRGRERPSVDPILFSYYFCTKKEDHYVIEKYYVFIETIKGTYSYHTSLEITSTLLLLAISLQQHSLHQVIIQQLCQYGSYHTMDSYFSFIIYCVITAYMLNHFQ